MQEEGTISRSESNHVNSLISGMLSSLDLNTLEIMMKENPLFRGYFQGYLAEQKLKDYLSGLPQVLKVEKIPDYETKKGDMLVHMQDFSFTIELKSMSSLDIKEDLLNGGYTGRVHVKNTDSSMTENGSTVATKRGTFDILAICTFPITYQWEFLFIHNRYLPASLKHPDRIQPNIQINTENTPCLHKDLMRVVSDIN